MSDMQVGRIHVDLTLNDTAYQAGLSKAQANAAAMEAKSRSAFKGVETGAAGAGKQVSALGQSFKGAALGLAAFAAAGAAMNFLKDSVTAASDLNEAINMTGLVFEENADQMVAWAKTGEDAFGQSTTAALSAAASFGNLFLNVGVEAGQAAEMSQVMVERAADMASAFNTSVPDAIQAMSAALRGEAEPARRYGIMLDDVTLKAKALEMGLYSGTGVLSQYAKAMAAQSIIMEKTSRIAGDFLNTVDDPANAARRLEAKMTNLQADIGKEFLPVYKEMLEAVKGVVEFTKEHLSTIQALVKAAVALGAVALAWKGIAKATELATAASGKYKAARAGGIGGKIGMGAGIGAAVFAAGTVANDAVRTSQGMRYDDGKQALLSAQLEQMLAGGDTNLAMAKTGYGNWYAGDLVALQANADATQYVANFFSSLLGDTGSDREAAIESMKVVDQTVAAALESGSISAVEAREVFASFYEEVGATGPMEDFAGEWLPRAQAELLKTGAAVQGTTSEVEAQNAQMREAAAASDRYAQAQEKVKQAQDGVKAAVEKAKAAIETYKDAFKGVRGDYAGMAFSGDPTDPKKALSQSDILDKSAGSRDYLKGLSADFQTLTKSGLSDAALDGLRELEQTAPGTVRKMVADGITGPFIKQLNKDFRQRSLFSKQIAEMFTLDERDAARRAKANVALTRQAHREAVTAAMQADAERATAGADWGSEGWAAGQSLATAAYERGVADDAARARANGQPVTINNFRGAVTVQAQNPEQLGRAMAKGRKSKNSAGRH